MSFYIWMGVDSEGQKLKKQNKALLLPGDVGGALPCQQISERERERESCSCEWEVQSDAGAFKSRTHTHTPRHKICTSVSFSLKSCVRLWGATGDFCQEELFVLWGKRTVFSACSVAAVNQPVASNQSVGRELLLSSVRELRVSHFTSRGKLYCSVAAL